VSIGFLNGNGKVYRDEDIRLTDLVGDDAILEGYKFINCRLKGPAVLLVEGEFNLAENTVEGDPEAVLWEIPPERERVIGAILLKDSTFEDCTFTNVGIAGYSDFIEAVRRGVEAQHALP
jgi:hypothetical protein